VLWLKETNNHKQPPLFSNYFKMIIVIVLTVISLYSFAPTKSVLTNKIKKNEV